MTSTGFDRLREEMVKLRPKGGMGSARPSRGLPEAGWEVLQAQGIVRIKAWRMREHDPWGTESRYLQGE